MNDQRPTFWPCSADSSRNAGPAPRSFRNAETGVSVSSMSVCVIGISRWPGWLPARIRTSSSDGVTFPMTAVRSAAAAIEHLRGVRQRQAARRQQHLEVVQDVGGLLGHPLVGLLAHGARDLLGLLAHLVAGEARIGEQLGGVRGR